MRRQDLSHDDAHSLEKDESHPLLPAASGQVCERPESLVVRGSAWASFRRRGWRLLRLRGVVRRGLRMGSVGVLGERLRSA